ncbi:hypothetical protein ElyMa_003130100 [Elysia marginata]|uniref:Uncharacterized protein n=1 Tax=Elysia marginata TaxID=1093978 RepID=A0AAV4IVV7_9GAST|nr:hypothetical protein ElyMa_003130100 [Elysia marginata]
MTFHNTDDSKTDESSRAAVQPQARRQASASFADLRYCTEYRVKGDQFHHTPPSPIFQFHEKSVLTPSYTQRVDHIHTSNPLSHTHGVMLYFLETLSMQLQIEDSFR